MKPNPYQQFLENVERWEAEQKADKATVYIPVASADEGCMEELEQGELLPTSAEDIHRRQVEANEKATAAVDAVAAATFGAARHEENCACRVCAERPSGHPEKP